jgi:hypothetical protein
MDSLASLVPFAYMTACGCVGWRMADVRRRDPMVWLGLSLVFGVVALFSLWRLPPVYDRKG